MQYYYYITDGADEHGIIKMPCEHTCCLDLFLKKSKDELNILSTDLKEKPVETTGFIGTFLENRLGKEFVWSVRMIGSIEEDFGIAML